MCSKKRFAEEWKVKLELERCRLYREVLGQKDRKEKSYYYCKQCQVYHLSHY